MTHEQFNTWYEDIPLLCYGELSSTWVLVAFYDILTWKQQGIFISEQSDMPTDDYTTTEYWLLLGLLYDCIDYGSSPRGAWLSDFGKQVLEHLSTLLICDKCGTPIIDQEVTDYCFSCAESTTFTPLKDQV